MFYSVVSLPLLLVALAVCLLCVLCSRRSLILQLNKVPVSKPEESLQPDLGPAHYIHICVALPNLTPLPRPGGLCWVLPQPAQLGDQQQTSWVSKWRSGPLQQGQRDRRQSRGLLQRDRPIYTEEPRQHGWKVRRTERIIIFVYCTVPLHKPMYLDVLDMWMFHHNKVAEMLIISCK